MESAYSHRLVLTAVLQRLRVRLLILLLILLLTRVPSPICLLPRFPTRSLGAVTDGTPRSSEIDRLPSRRAPPRQTRA